jgi:flagellar basal body-associated protein FliL
MKLENIDKTRYRKHLNRIIWISIISLIVLSLSTSSFAIYLLNDGETSHFWINVAGVVVAVVIIASILTKYKQHSFMYEVAYIWDLKQVLNQIHRKSKKINLAVAENNVTAITIMYFYYKACLQLYTLDDNTITLSSLNIKAAELDSQIESLNLTITTDNFDSDRLSAF